MIEISESFLFFFLLGIRYLSGDLVVMLSPYTDILEIPRLSLIFFLIVITVDCCYLILLSSELDDDIDLFLVSSFTVSSVSFFKEDFDLSNEVNLFSAMSFSISLLIGFSKYEYNAFYLTVFKLPTASLI